MSLERTNNFRNLQHVQDECKKYLDYHIILSMTDGQKFDGIIVSVESRHIVVLVGEDMINQECENQANQERVFKGGARPIGGGFHGGGFPVGGGFRRFRRFRRRNFPLGTLAALTLLQYPYINSPYTYDDYYDDNDGYYDDSY